MSNRFKPGDRVCGYGGEKWGTVEAIGLSEPYEPQIIDVRWDGGNGVDHEYANCLWLAGQPHEDPKHPRRPLTVSELIEALQQFDGTATVYVNSKTISGVGGEALTATRSVYLETR